MLDTPLLPINSLDKSDEEIPVKTVESSLIIPPSLVNIAPCICNVLGFGKLIGLKSQNGAKVGKSIFISVKNLLHHKARKPYYLLLIQS